MTVSCRTPRSGFHTGRLRKLLLISIISSGSASPIIIMPNNVQVTGLSNNPNTGTSVLVIPTTIAKSNAFDSASPSTSPPIAGNNLLKQDSSSLNTDGRSLVGSPPSTNLSLNILAVKDPSPNPNELGRPVPDSNSLAHLNSLAKLQAVTVAAIENTSPTGSGESPNFGLDVQLLPEKPVVDEPPDIPIQRPFPKNISPPSVARKNETNETKEKTGSNKPKGSSGETKTKDNTRETLENKKDATDPRSLGDVSGTEEKNNTTTTPLPDARAASKKNAKIQATDPSALGADVVPLQAKPTMSAKANPPETDAPASSELLPPPPETKPKKSKKGSKAPQKEEVEPSTPQSSVLFAQTQDDEVTLALAPPEVSDQVTPPVKEPEKAPGAKTGSKTSPKRENDRSKPQPTRDSTSTLKVIDEPPSEPQKQQGQPSQSPKQKPIGFSQTAEDGTKPSSKQEIDKSKPTGDSAVVLNVVNEPPSEPQKKLADKSQPAQQNTGGVSQTAVLVAAGAVGFLIILTVLVMCERKKQRRTHTKTGTIKSWEDDGMREDEDEEPKERKRFDVGIPVEIGLPTDSVRRSYVGYRKDSSDNRHSSSSYPKGASSPGQRSFRRRSDYDRGQGSPYNESEFYDNSRYRQSPTLSQRGKINAFPAPRKSRQ